MVLAEVPQSSGMIGGVARVSMYGTEDLGPGAAPVPQQAYPRECLPRCVVVKCLLGVVEAGVVSWFVIEFSKDRFRTPVCRIQLVVSPAPPWLARS